ncbi:MAG: FG-GAP repeat protein [Planctomycetes bacterium]|nr:FG-GAP repeat protein [Planctomycetota bacterium]
MRTVLTLTALALLAASAFAGNANFEARLDGSLVGVGSDAGWSAALEGDVAVVGAPGEGAAYVFEKQAGVWVEKTRLQASLTTPGDRFGEAVALRGGVIVVGAPDSTAGSGMTSGAAFVFRKLGAVWTEVDVLSHPSPGFNDDFGSAVSTDGDRIIVGAPFTPGTGFLQGAAYIFDDPVTSDDFSDVTPVISADIADLDFYGRGVDIEGDVAAVGADLDDDNGDASGSVYVFRFGGGGWAEEDKLKPADGAALDQFGLFIDFDGNRLAVSSTAADIGGVQDAGAIYTFLYAGGVWSQEDKVVSSAPITNGQFGSDLALDGSLMIAGEAVSSSSAPVAGTVHEVRLSAGTWTDVSDTTANGGTLGDWFGFALDLDGAVFVGGAPRDALLGNDAGTAFVQGFGERFPTVCVGDGTLTSCPCGNNSTLGNGEGCRNSQGLGAVLAANGSASVATDDLVFAVDQARPGAPGIFIQGTVLVTIPFKDGILCMGNPTERLEVIFLSATGTGNSAESVVSNCNVLPGQTRYYQFWYRDPQVSPCGTGSNFTNGLTVDWQ